MDLGGSLSYHQWELLETSVKILRPFEEATGTISKDEASLSFVIPCVQALKATLGNLEADAAVRKLPDAEKLVLALKYNWIHGLSQYFTTPLAHTSRQCF